eukprot:3862533-Rhodomonas_salina.2
MRSARESNGSSVRRACEQPWLRWHAGCHWTVFFDCLNLQHGYQHVSTTSPPAHPPPLPLHTMPRANEPEDSA